MVFGIALLGVATMSVIGVPLIIVLMRFLSSDERKRATAVDGELDMPDAPCGLWSESDPQLRDRMGRR
jgi:hypothetical protein